MTLVGTGFGASQDANVSAWIGDDACSTTTWISATSLGCEIDVDGGWSARPIAVSVPPYGLSIPQAGASFHYAAPVIDLGSQPSITVPTDGSYFKLTGRNFGSEDHGLVCVAGEQSLPATWLSDTSISCPVPAREGLSNIHLQVGDAAGGDHQSVTYREALAFGQACATGTSPATIPKVGGAFHAVGRNFGSIGSSNPDTAPAGGCEACAAANQVGEGQVRLGDEEGGCGRVEVMHSGQWGSVCGAGGFDMRAAEVVCRQLGLAGGIVNSSSAPAADDVPIWVGNASCIGDEANLTECQLGSWNQSGCSHEQDVAVCCGPDYAPNPSGEGEARIIGGGQHGCGAVEVFSGGKWGAVCANDWGDADAEVLCRQLGRSGGRALSPSQLRAGSQSLPMPYNGGGGAINALLGGLGCTGEELDISRCSAAQSLGSGGGCP